MRFVAAVVVAVVAVVVGVGGVACTPPCDDDADCRVRAGRISCGSDGECQAKATSNDACVDLGEGGECRGILNGGECQGIGGRVFAAATGDHVGAAGGDVTVCVELEGTCNADDGSCKPLE